MAKIKTSIALDEDLLKWVDTQIEKRRFANRTHAVEYALQQLIDSEKMAIAQKGIMYPQSQDLDLVIAEGDRKAYSKKKLRDKNAI
jgi:Arc/MetJ-type ribon-helix-helix transcriptional regulator